MYSIDDETLKNIITHLQGQPWGEVNHMLQPLLAAIQSQNDANAQKERERLESEAITAFLKEKAENENMDSSGPINRN